jgi:hypothetical protein
MWTLTLPRETWPRIIDALRAKGLPYVVAHADVLQQRVDQAPADRDRVRLSLRDDLYWRSVYWAAWSLGMKLPVVRDGGHGGTRYALIKVPCGVALNPQPGWRPRGPSNAARILKTRG